jgi:cytochrome c-type biogenesis protein
MKRLALVWLVALAFPVAALGSEEHPTLRELEGELMCPTCETTLELSNAPAANQIRRFVRARIAAGDTKSEIEDKLVAEFGRLGERGVARRVVVASIPFVLGFTIVFVVLGAGAAALGSLVDAQRRAEFAGFVLVVLGLALVGLLPWSERLVAPELVAGARRRGSGALLGAAFAVVAAPCIGAVLASILVLAADAETVVRGAILLAAYSLGLGTAFLLIGVAFARAMGAFRWIRDRYGVIRVVSGLTLVALGLLLFFHRDWWLRVALNRALSELGLGTLD